MTTSQTKTPPNSNAEHHTKAAEFCDKAEAEHRHAAKSCVAGDHKKMAEHAQDHHAMAQDHSKRAATAA